MSCPKNYYWRLPEGFFTFGEKDWLDSVANSVGLDNCFVLTKRRMGGVNSSTVLYTLANQDRFNDTRKIVVKEISKSKAVKYAALGLWESKLKFNDTIFRLGNEYKALRYIRRFGLHSPSIIGLILNKRTIITEYIQGKRLSDVIQAYLEGKDNDDDYNNNNKNDCLSWIRLAAKHIAQIHSDKSTFGNLRPKNLILSGEHIFFTNLERFGFKKGDPVRDIAQFISWSLVKTRNVVLARNVIMAFLDSYSHKQTFDNLIQYANSNRYLEVHYPLLSSAIAMTIKPEMRNFVR
jgi:tRNA A-37 threonylcarbamoyl transferase component Bud32